MDQLWHLVRNTLRREPVHPLFIIIRPVSKQRRPFCWPQFSDIVPTCLIFSPTHLWCLMPSQQHIQFLHIEQLDRPLLLEDCERLVFNILTLKSKFLLLLVIGPFVATRGHLQCNEQVIAGHVSPISHMKATTMTFHLLEHKLASNCVWLRHSIFSYLFDQHCCKILGIIPSLNEMVDSSIVCCLNRMLQHV